LQGSLVLTYTLKGHAVEQLAGRVVGARGAGGTRRRSCGEENSEAAGH
jgi:hypothetical protein